MQAKYIAVLEEDLDKYTNALNLAATLIDMLNNIPIDDESGDHFDMPSWQKVQNALLACEEFTNLKTALLELGYEIT